jgi:HAD superfamily hydrolase (TIGR01549 family)
MKKINSYSGILLDLDNTLYDYNRCHLNAINNVEEYCQSKLGIGVDDFNREYKSGRKSINIELANTASSHNRLLYFQRALENLSVNPLSVALDLYNAYWNTFLDTMELDEGVTFFFQSLKETNICLITDLTAHIQYRKVRKLGLEGYIQNIVTSEEAGVEKPNPHIFKTALSKLDKPINEVCMIGDNYQKDIVGAVSIGIEAYWMNRENEDRKTHPLSQEFINFKELL